MRAYLHMVLHACPLNILIPVTHQIQDIQNSDILSKIFHKSL